MQGADIGVWVDGGWGVDALLEKQTRKHGDLDIVIRTTDLVRLREVLSDFVEKDGGEPWNFVLADRKGCEVDVHAIDFDAEGNGLYGPPERGLPPYPARAFDGVGRIGDLPVKCLTAEYQMVSHTGYELDENDFKDVTALNRKFGIPIPLAYDQWLGQNGDRERD